MISATHVVPKEVREALHSAPLLPPHSFKVRKGEHQAALELNPAANPPPSQQPPSHTATQPPRPSHPS
ncbi:hypothetical protein E2C01_051338 [Portunus trituberculatus]|uniref:Uncharacterized protein n=1 Tax=Portunus trituberculatus TaxID=210409 RepID=A0A5B7GIM5_PORTR|nr:hypothetical protein [Portunus trituberculatus]